MGTEALLFPRLAGEFGFETGSQLADIVGRVVGQATPFAGRPDVLDRIEFWGVGRQAVKPNPTAGSRREEVLRLAVRPEVVPHDVQLAV